ncbi:HD domain-containing protein [Vibrio sp. 404]|uniref:HD domain-containing protein n=1 Tax=Vibrio marinisediminis TaxID=2758441 RepID=A0A7W2FS50_9VIBR|nr:HD domain-containing phosphohydrolase [Vibrio marinisediminis]MBA5763245.1 HD domain-containing protein [Vibrio marinisediminis]
MFCSEAYAEQWQSKNILVIHSYAPSYQWTSDFQAGIESALKLSNANVKLSIEYLDTKRVVHKNFYDEFTQYFTAKYQNYHFDAVLVTDDNAITMLNEWEDNPLRGLPIVAGGINNKSATLDNLTEQSHIIFEKDEIEKTLALIETLRPKLKTLYYVSDRSATSELIRKDVLAELKELGTYRVEEIRDLSLEDAVNVVSNISVDDAVLLTHYNTEVEQGTYHRYNFLAHEFAKNSNAPVFVFWEFYITNGVVGGHVHRSTQIGMQMVSALNRFIPLELRSDLKVTALDRPVIDYQVLDRFGLKSHLLPENTVFKNQPKSFIKENWQIISVGLSIFFCMTLIIITQAIAIRQKKELNKQSRKIVRLQKKTMQTQKDMIVVLGEAIETRSGETGNHVKRVAQISSLLGSLYGLSNRELELIEIVSPMHDVGKIAIPEAILDKPGKLNEQEWEIMQTHTSHGHRLLSSSKGYVFKLAAMIAHQHHERWDGNGYPNGLSQTEIHVFARITAVADVFDALLSVRCYKQPWSIKDVIDHFDRERGAQFDPYLVDLLLENWAQFIEIRNTYPDKTN